MKKFILSLVVLCALLFLSLRADIVTVTVPPNGCTNLVVGAAVVQQFTLTSTNGLTSVIALDAPALGLSYTNNAYSNLVSYATNYIVMWTNYWGATNYSTNISLVDVTNTVAASTNSYPARIAVSALSTTTTKLDALQTTFVNGITITNTQPTNAFVTVRFTH